MKKCLFCCAEIKDNQEKCYYCGKEQKVEPVITNNNQENVNNVVNNTPVDNTPVSNTPVDNNLVDNTSVSNTPVENTSVDNTSVSNTPVENTSVDNTSVDNTPVSNTPVSKILVNNDSFSIFPTNNTIYIALIIIIIGCILSCFLPYISVGSSSINYVYNESFNGIRIKDGAFVVALCFFSLILLIMKKRIPVFIFQLLSLGIFVIDYFNDKDMISLLGQIAPIKYGIGFYLVLIFAIASVVLSFIRLTEKEVYV